MNDAPQILAVPEPLLVAFLFGACLLALASFFAGFWCGVAGERKRKGL